MKCLHHSVWMETMMRIMIICDPGGLYQSKNEEIEEIFQIQLK